MVAFSLILYLSYFQTKFYLCDENFLKDAEKLLSAEFTLVLSIQPEEVGAYIQSVIGLSNYTD